MTQTPGNERPSGAASPGVRQVPGLYLGRPFGVPLFISPTWIVLAAVITVWLADRFVPAGVQPGPRAYALAFGVAVLIAASVVAHELSHSVVARALRLPVRRVTILFLGGVSEIDKEPQTPAREYLVAVAGPLTSLLLAGGFIGLRQLSSGVLAEYAAIAAITNGAVGVLNLLPGLPLDGGRVLRAVVWRLTDSRLRGTTWAAHAGRVLAVLTIFVPVVHAGAAGESARKMAAADVVSAGLVAAFLWGGATVELRRERLRQRLPAVDAGRLARRACAVEAHLSVAEAVRRARAAGVGALVVVDRAGVPQAIVPEPSVAAMPPHRQPWVSVAEIATPLAPGHTIRVGLAGEPLLTAMQSAPASEYLVVASDGTVVGVLVAADVAESLQYATAPAGA